MELSTLFCLQIRQRPQGLKSFYMAFSYPMAIIGHVLILHFFLHTAFVALTFWPVWLSWQHKFFKEGRYGRL